MDFVAAGQRAVQYGVEQVVWQQQPSGDEVAEAFLEHLAVGASASQFKASSFRETR